MERLPRVITGTVRLWYRTVECGIVPYSIICTERMFPLGLFCGPGVYGNGTYPNPFVDHALLILPSERCEEFVSF